MPSSTTPLESSATPSTSTSSCLPPASRLPRPRVTSLAAIKSRAADARAGFQHFLSDAGGHIVLTPIPAQLQQEHSPSSANPSVTVEPSPRSYHRAHRYTSSLTSTTLPPGSLAREEACGWVCKGERKHEREGENRGTLSTCDCYVTDDGR
ncbi:hypothetical protein M405DRAFT_870290 [Rhizopogon salebrosus TDB-379]|nr:hypothetical protein M405DRAFT_870290 [Rhizopogon salebrosus TDB-379]